MKAIRHKMTWCPMCVQSNILQQNVGVCWVLVVLHLFLKGSYYQKCAFSALYRVFCVTDMLLSKTCFLRPVHLWLDQTNLNHFWKKTTGKKKHPAGGKAIAYKATSLLTLTPSCSQKAPLSSGSLFLLWTKMLDGWNFAPQLGFGFFFGFFLSLFPTSPWKELMEPHE